MHAVARGKSTALLLRLPCLLIQDLLLVWKTLVPLIGQWGPEICLPLAPENWDDKWTTILDFFPWALDFELDRSWYLHSKHSTNVSISTDLQFSFLEIIPMSKSSSLCCAEGHTVLMGNSLVHCTLCSCVGSVSLRHIRWIPEQIFFSRVRDTPLGGGACCQLLLLEREGSQAELWLRGSGQPAAFSRGLPLVPLIIHSTPAHPQPWVWDSISGQAWVFCRWALCRILLKLTPPPHQAAAKMVSG